MIEGNFIISGEYKTDSNELESFDYELPFKAYIDDRFIIDSATIDIDDFYYEVINDNILEDSRFDDFIEDDMRRDITDSKETINDAKELLIGDGYSRVIINTKLPLESEETFSFIQNIKDELGSNVNEVYVIGDSPMAYEMSKTFGGELDFITILTMIAIFAVVAITFKSIISTHAI